jgi:aminoethylphosphonate catabolism LysR family transcriptional regulator
MVYQQLRAFHAVASEGGFTRAAAVLHRTQPAVSAQVKALESRYGVTLFERVGRGVTITEFGQRLLEITRRMFALEEEADHALRSARTPRFKSLKIAADAPYSLSQILGSYCQRNPSIHVSVAMGNGEAIVRDLLARDIDAAVLVRVQTDPRFAVVRYTRHRLVVIVGRDHPWATRTNVSIRDLQGKPMVVRDTRFSLTSQVLEEALRERRITPDVRMKVDSRENLREAVAAGVAIGVTAEPDAIADRRLKSLSFRDLDLSISDYLVCLKERREVPSINAFFELAVLKKHSATFKLNPSRRPKGFTSASKGRAAYDPEDRRILA